MKSMKNIVIGLGILLSIAAAYHLYKTRRASKDTVKIQVSGQSVAAMKLASSKSSTVQQGLQGAQKAVEAIYVKNAQAQDKAFGKLLSQNK